MIDGKEKIYILRLVDEFKKDKEFFLDVTKKENTRDKKYVEGVGSNNIRAMANIANNAECFEEIKLFIQYKISKGNGWHLKLERNKVSFGQKIINDITKIYESVEKNDSKALERIGLYFGYLYWLRSSYK